MWPAPGDGDATAVPTVLLSAAAANGNRVFKKSRREL